MKTTAFKKNQEAPPHTCQRWRIWLTCDSSGNEDGPETDILLSSVPDGDVGTFYTKFLRY